MPIYGIEPQLKNTTVMDDTISINNMKKHADKIIESGLFKIIRCT